MILDFLIKFYLDLKFSLDNWTLILSHLFLININKLSDLKFKLIEASL